MTTASEDMAPDLELAGVFSFITAGAVFVAPFFVTPFVADSPDPDLAFLLTVLDTGAEDLGGFVAGLGEDFARAAGFAFSFEDFEGFGALAFAVGFFSAFVAGFFGAGFFAIKAPFKFLCFIIYLQVHGPRQKI